MTTVKKKNHTRIIHIIYCLLSCFPLSDINRKERKAYSLPETMECTLIFMCALLLLFFWFYLTYLSLAVSEEPAVAPAGR